MFAKTITEVIAQLDFILENSVKNNDRAGYFAALYRNVTLGVASKIKEGYFDDNERMEKLDVVFANRYLEAVDLFKSGKPCTLSWQLAFKATMEWKPMVIHHLIEGMNAHIGLDLGIAAASIAPGNKIMDIKDDFDKINTILNEMVEEVKNDLFDIWPLSKFILKLNIGKLENAIAGFSMSVARDAAWKVAIEYAALSSNEQKMAYINDRDIKVTAFGKKVLYPGGFINALIYLFRLFEFGSIPEKIKKLADN